MNLYIAFLLRLPIVVVTNPCKEHCKICRPTTEKISMFDAEAILTIIRRYPLILRTYIFGDQVNVEILDILLEHGYVPSEEYIYRVCERELVDVVRLLCEYDIFRKVVSLDRLDEFLAMCAAKRSIATIFLECGCISQDVFDSNMRTAGMIDSSGCQNGINRFPRATFTAFNN